jgi:hypothetical protein
VLYAGIELSGALGDVVFVAIILAFFALCVAFVRACAVIAGPDPADTVEGGQPVEEVDQVAPHATVRAELKAEVNA